uniref:hypothetical protein n=1 Tax=Candidatus Cryptobacteroides bacterium TaxID=3085639 RepID=UPI004029F7AF
MARIVYKKGCEGQNRLECIEGIEIELLNGQKALIYPRYSERVMLPEDKIYHWNEKDTTEIESLKREDNVHATEALLRCGSPAAKYVSNFRSNKYGTFNLPSLMAAMEINHQMKEINNLAMTVKGAMHFEKYSVILSCSRCTPSQGWVASDCGCAGGYYL